MRDSKKKPVLTSPWKIGMFVSLMLLVVSFGVGYYLVNVYKIDLTWLHGDASKWIVDSFAFFKEIYPLVAGVVLIALVTYFMIASAVRRYKFYLDSGQDYRKMISLADSVDDLTNPAQIARLSNYPELQEILRNYGDQIREISEEMNQKEKEMRSVDLEMEIDSVLKGNPIQDTLVEGKWWAPLVRKVEEYVSLRGGADASESKHNEAMKRTAGQTVLSCGKMLESVAGANGDILEIVRAIGELNSVAKQMGRGAQEQTPAFSPDGNAAPGTYAELLDSVGKLEEMGRVLHDFSEENNGLALNIALMAAKGNVEDKELARYAEKVRSSAERSNKLGAAISTVASKLAGNFNKLGSSAQQGGGEFGAPIVEISGKIEKKSHMLQGKLTELGSEIEEINENFQKCLSQDDGADEIAVDREEETTRKEGFSEGDRSIVNFGSGEPEKLSVQNDFVIDHGHVWDGCPTADESPDKGMSLDDSAIAESPAGPDAGDEISFGDFDDQGGLPEEDALPGGGRETGEGPEEGGEWMEMPGHRWVKIDVEKSGNELSRDNVQVEVDAGPGVQGPDSAPPMSQAPAAGGPSQVSMDPHGRKEEEEPIYDLFELGAVEYEETPSR